MLSDLDFQQVEWTPAAPPEQGESDTLLLTDSDPERGRRIADRFARQGYRCQLAVDHPDALRKLIAEETALVLLVCDGSAAEIYPWLDAIGQARNAPVQLVLVPEERDAQRVVIQADAFDYLVLSRLDDQGYWEPILQRALRQHHANREAFAVRRILRHNTVIFDASPDMILVLDGNRRILHCNLAVENYTGRARRELIGERAHQVLCGDHHSAEACPLGGGLHEGDRTRPICRMQRRTQTFQMRSIPLFTRDGKVWGTMEILQNVTELIQAEQALNHRLEIEKLIAEISVEFAHNEDMDQAIHRTLARIGLWSQALNTYVFLLREDKQFGDLVYEWTASGAEPIGPKVQNLRMADFPWWREQLEGDGLLRITDVSQLSPTAWRERRVYEELGIQSLLAQRLFLYSDLIGFVGFANLPNTSVLHKSDQVLLEVTAGLICSGLERKRRQQERDLLAQAIDASEEIIQITDMEGRLQYINPAFERVTGCPPEEAENHTLLRRQGTEEDRRRAEEIRQTLHKGGVWRGRMSRRRCDGRSYEEDVTISPIRNAQGEIVHCVAIRRDVTEQVHMEMDLRHAQKLESIGQLAAGIAHEINTPIQYVGDNTRFLQESFVDLIGLVEMYRQRIARLGAPNPPAVAQILADLRAHEEEFDLNFLTSEVPQAIRQSLEGIERVATIVRAMKEFSHPGNHQKVLVDLNRAIESTATVSRSEWKYVAELTTDLDPALPPVACYPGELNQALLNLIINAAQAIGERKRDTTCGKGSIHITTRYLKDADQVEIRIRDDGGGIPEEIRDRIFDPFFTTKPIGKGSGQGLPIVYSVIHDKHGGQVDFVSCVGEGSVFKLRLPVAKMEDPAEVVAERAPLPDAATFPA